MKKKLIYLLVSLLAVSFAACSSDDKIKIFDEYIVEPVLSFNKIGDSSFVVKEETLDKIEGKWVWTEANFGGVATDIKYDIMIDTAKDFSSEKILTSIISDTIATMTQKILNTGAIQFINETQEITLYARLRTSMGTSVAGPVLYSNSTSVKFTCMGEAQELYMIGADFGNWDWNSKDVITMIPVHPDDDGNGEQSFWAISYFTKDNGFKWGTKKDWEGSFEQQKSNSGFTTTDGNAFVAADGLYMVYIDMKNSAIHIEPAIVYGMGDCFGGYHDDLYPFNLDAGGKTVSLTTSAAGDLRMYAKSSYAKAVTPWWTREFIILDGKIVYRGNDKDEQTRVNVAAGKKVTLDFKAGTGTIE